MHPIGWFWDRIGTEILRGRTRIIVTNDNYQKLYDIQSENYTFTAPPTIHKSDNQCTSCEG